MIKICRKRKEKKEKLASCKRTMLFMGKGYRIDSMNGKRLAASCSLDKGLKASKQDEDGAAVMVPAGPALGPR